MDVLACYGSTFLFYLSFCGTLVHGEYRFDMSLALGEPLLFFLLLSNLSLPIKIKFHAVFHGEMSTPQPEFLYK